MSSAEQTVICIIYAMVAVFLLKKSNVKNAPHYTQGTLIDNISPMNKNFFTLTLGNLQKVYVLHTNCAFANTLRPRF